MSIGTIWMVLAGCGVAEPEPVEGLGEYTLVWSDEFDGSAGAAIDPDKWVHDVGGDGWGNEQLEYNTDRTDNVRQSGDGSLEIVALKEDYEGNAYTSGRITTEGLFDHTYGRFEARIKLPEGQGLWPAFWMLGADFAEVSWPACGEIDVMELRGEKPYVSLGTVHGPGYSGGEGIGDDYTLAEGTFADDFHVFAVDFDPEHIVWSVDGVAFQTLTPGDLPEGTGWVFNKPFFMILNLAVGGVFLEEPDEDTVFPAVMEVDYVRVYERSVPLTEDTVE